MFAIGLSKGSVVFVSLRNMACLYTRISFHRERIIALDALKSHKEDARCSTLVSLCTEGYVKLVVFIAGVAECIKSFNCNQ